MVPGMWPDTTGVSIRVLMRLVPEQSRETFLEQKVTVQIRIASLSLPRDSTSLYRI